MRWVPIEGWWPRTVVWLCRRNSRWAKEYARQRIIEEENHRRMQAVLSTCWETQQVVTASEDENGDLIIKTWGEK